MTQSQTSRKEITPTQRRESDFYKAQYVHEFVRKWDDLIDWDARAESEGDFFIRLLKKRNAKRVLDVATGTGFHSVQLLKAGFDVTSVDGSPNMLAQAFENARRHGLILKTVCADWRWLCRDVHAKYDAVVCLGNSFTHLFTQRDRRKALAEFYSVLKHDGILIIDQRNYDSILDEGFDSKHIYYYCGEDVRAAPEYVDEGLARFRYDFPDGSHFFLNMFPIRRQSLRELTTEVGFSDVKSYGDFKETYHHLEPDFFVHVAEKAYKADEKVTPKEVKVSGRYDESVETARDYYNSEDADQFYYLVWGGEDIHIGLYEPEDISIRDASRQTVERMAEKLGDIDENTRILDIGSGYAGSARYLTKKYGCHVGCLNLSERQNQRAREKNEEEGLGFQINVVDGSFEEIPMASNSVDVVWSQDAILHSGHRVRVFEEVNRVLKPGGLFVFTDPMVSSDSDAKLLQPILDRIQLSSMGSLSTYRKYAKAMKWEEVEWEDLTDQLVNHYSRVGERLEAEYDSLIRHCSADYLQRMKTGLGHWVKGGQEGTLQWGIVVFRKPE